MRIGIIGGGAAGFFSAITMAENNDSHNIVILEKSQNTLSKVRVSGGGRCNVTNALTDQKEFVKNYPRGSKELLSVFSKFSNADTIQWFKEKGVTLKTEQDGRVFPETNDSQTIINLFNKLVSRYGVDVLTGFDVNEVSIKDNKFVVKDRKGNTLYFDKLLVSCGGFSTIDKYKWIEKLGHTIVPPVPSLFTFNCKDILLKDLQGISVKKAGVKIKGTKLYSNGDLLITHWGFSGPAILKLSAFGARTLSDLNYKFTIEICWTDADVSKIVDITRNNNSLKHIIKHPLCGIPVRLWESFILNSGIKPEKRYNELSKKDAETIKNILTKSEFKITGKSTFKEEFVTAGGVSLKEIDFRTMESKAVRELFFAGEIIDIDGVTGGFNFQSAWSTGYVAGCGICNKNI